MPIRWLGYLVLEPETRRLLAGVGHNPHRAWVFPLHTPRGLNTVQEYAFDHPFHNGVFVGQGRVIKGDQLTNFWAPSLDWRQSDNPIFQHIGTIRYGAPPQVDVSDDGVTFIYAQTVWRDEHGASVLDERRKIRVFETDDATVCDVMSTKTAAYSALQFDATKHSSIGARVQPQLLPLMGGQIVAGSDGQLRRGLADEVASGKLCDFVAYENELQSLGRFGICLTLLDNTASPNRQGPWFIHDYGMAMFNATMNEAMSLKEGESWRVALQVVAYDGAITAERAARWSSL